MKTSLFILIALLLPLVGSGQTTYIFQKKTGATTTEVEVTPQNSKAFGLDGSGNLSMLSVSGASTLASLTDVALTDLAGGHLLQYNEGTGKWNNVSTSTGGNGAADAGKVVEYGVSGRLAASGVLQLLSLLGEQAQLNILSPSNAVGATIQYNGTTNNPVYLLADVAGTHTLLSTTAANAAYQPLDSDLTSIAALATTVYGRSLLTSADASAAKGLLGLGNVENIALSTWGGSASITTLGTIGAGTWQGATISPVYGGTGETSLGDTADVLGIPQPAGAWADATAYSQGDLVSSAGAYYLCTASHTSSPSDEPGVGLNYSSYWTFFVASGGVSDGDKGDIVVSSGGTAWAVDSAVKSTGGNGAADAGKLAIFGAGGELQVDDDWGIYVGAASDNPRAHLTKSGLSVSMGFANKTTLAFTEPSSGLKTVTVPHINGTLVTTGDTGTVTNTMLAGSIDLASKVTGLLPLASIAQGGATSGQALAWNGTAWAPATIAGAGSIEIDTAAWVEADGNDGTGALGDPARPFLTMAAAYTAGARMLFVGAGTFAGLSTPGPITVRILGLGRAATTITEITTGGGGGNITIYDLGCQSFTVGSINAAGTAGAAMSAGTGGGNIALHGVCAGLVSAAGGIGGASDETAANAGPGGSGGSLTLTGACLLTTATLGGGAGGTAVDFDGAAGGGGGSAVIGIGSEIGVLILSGGSGGESVNTTDGNGGNAGNLQAAHVAIDTLHIGGGAGNISGTDGTINGSFIFAGTMAATPTINAVASHIGGTWHE